MVFEHEPMHDAQRLTPPTTRFLGILTPVGCFCTYREGRPLPHLLPATEKEKAGEVGAVVGFVVEELNSELYREMMEGLRIR